MRFRGLFAAVVGIAATHAFALPPANPVHTHHNYDLIDVKWDVTLDFPHRAIKGNVVNTLKPTEATSTLLFDFGNLRVIAVTVNGKPATAKHEGAVLTVTAGANLAANTMAKVRIRYEGQPDSGMYFVPKEHAFPAKTDIVYTQGEMEDNHNWLPTYDFPDDKATSEGTIHVPSGWSVLSNGKLVGKTDDGKQATWHWKIDQPHSTYLISLVAGPYTEVKDGPARVPVSIWAPKGLETWGLATFGGTNKILECYGRITGIPFPWPKYAQSAVPDFMFGGMENVTCTTQTIGALFPPEMKGHLDETGLAAHELAHQWTGDLWTAPNWAHIWVNEGWASFLPSFYTREAEGQDAFDISRVDTYNGGIGGHQADPTRPLVFTGYLRPIEMFDGFAYAGGASRMFMLMHKLGEPVFWKSIKTLFTDRGFKNVDTEQFFASVSATSGVDLEAFRKQWFYTAGVPKITVNRHPNGSATITGTQGYAFETKLGFLTSKGTLHRVDRTITEAPIEIPGTDADGELAFVDPDAWLMAEIEYQGLTASDWLKLYSAAPNAGQRARLLDATFGSIIPEQRVSLARNEKSPILLQRMVTRISDPAYLIELTGSKNRGIQEAATGTLGSVAKSDAVLARLHELYVRGDELVRLAALKSLVQLTNDETLVTKAWATDGFRDEFRTWALDWWAGHNADFARSQSIKVLQGSYNEPVRQTAVRVLGRLKDKPGERIAYNLLVKEFESASSGGKRNVMGALAAYGDKAAFALIRPYAENPLSFTSDSANNALARLK